MNSRRCPCGAQLESLYAAAIGVCDRCRMEAKKPARRPGAKTLSQDGLFDEPEGGVRRLVPVDDWPER